MANNKKIAGKSLNNLEWHTEKRKVAKLIPYSNNPRQITKKQLSDLKSSLKKFNLVDIPSVNLDGTLIGGHQRLSVLIAEGRENEMIDVRIPNRNLNSKELRELNIRLNKNTAEWDFDILANENELDELIGFGFNKIDLNISASEKPKEKSVKTCPNCGCEL